MDSSEAVLKDAGISSGNPGVPSMDAVALLEALPAPVYTCDKEGYLTFYNRAAAILWGRSPVLKKDRWCGSFQAFKTDGSPLPLEECPTAITLKTGEPSKGVEFIVAAPDGARRHVIANPEIIRDASGHATGIVNMLVDVTDQRHAEAARAHADLLISESSSPVIQLDEDNRIRFTNPTSRRILEHLHLRSGDPAPESWLGGRSGEKESIVETSVGDKIYAIRSVVDVYSGGTNLHFDDITRFKNAESELRLTELKFRSLATQAPVGIFLSAPNGEALFVNEKWCEMSGISAGEALGTGWSRAIHPDDLEHVTSIWNHALENRTKSYLEFRFLRPDGSVTWVQGGAIPMEDELGGFNGYIGSCVDITERKNSEDTLEVITAESEKKRRLYDGILSTTPDLAYVFDLDHRFIYANPALLQMWGKTLEDSIGKNCLEIGYEPWHAAMHGREIELVKSTRMPTRGEVPFPHDKDGVRVYDYILSPVIGADGEVEVVAGTTRDVTERKQMIDRAIFLSELGGKLIKATTEEEITLAVVEAVGKKVQAQRCFFIESEKNGDFAISHGRWNSAGAPESGQEFSPTGFADLEMWKDGTMSPPGVNDVMADVSIAPHAGKFIGQGVRSYCSQHFNADEKRVITLMVTCDHVRNWTDWECGLIEHVVARIWPLVERLRSENALRESQQRLRLVSDHVSSLISHLDADETFRFVNKRFEEWFGIEPEKLVGTRLDQLLGEEILAQRRPFIDRVLSGEPVSFEGITNHQTLGPRDVHVAYDPDFGPDGEVRGFYMMSLDITERKKAEKLLKRRTIHSNILWEAAGIILSAGDPDIMLQKVFGKINELLKVDAFFNFMVKPDGSGLELISSQGIPASALPGLAHLDFGQAICGTVAQQRTAIVRQCIQSSDDPMVQLVKGFGFKAYACNPLVVGDRLLGTLSFASTKREQFEEDEIEFMATISHYVTGAYVRHQLLDSLRVADRRKDEFLATLAHELRNPLAPIRTGLEILKMKGGQSAPDERIRSMMERQVEQLITLVNDLLDVSRITRGKLELRTCRVDLSDAIQSATEASLPEIQQAGQYLQLVIPEETVFLDADANRLAQILSNLLNNASRYSEKGSAIRLEISLSSSFVEMRVVDQGIGIAPEMLHSIFEMFTQVQTAGRQNGGLGIGLTLVKSLAEMHGGQVWAESHGVGSGSSFIVRLPRMLEDAEVIENSSSPEERSPGLRVVVVDDNRPAAETLSMALEMLGHEVKTGFSGPEGIDIVNSFQPDFAFLDLGMPGMDGCETARLIRSSDIGKKVKLVALTGWGQDEARLRTSSSGFDHHLVKPADLNDLRALFRSHSQGR